MTRQRQLRGHRPTRPSDRAALTADHQRFLAAHLTPRDRWLARTVHELRVLTAPQIAQLAFASPRVANRRLLLLYQWRVLDRFQPYLTAGSAPMHYVLDTAGAAALAAEDDLTTGTFGYRHDRAIEIAHSLRLAHTVGTNGLYTALVGIANHSGPHGSHGDARAVTAWWPEARCARHFGEHVRPDAYGRWHENGQEIEFFLEYDCGTESLARVAAKLAGYERLAAASGISTPVLFWFPTQAREESARRALSITHADLPRPDIVPVATTAVDTSSGPGPDSPAGARWAPLAPCGPNTDLRVRLAQLAEMWPHAAPPPHTTARDPEPTHQQDRSGLRPPTPMPPATARVRSIAASDFR